LGTAVAALRPAAADSKQKTQLQGSSRDSNCSLSESTTSCRKEAKSLSPYRKSEAE